MSCEVKLKEHASAATPMLLWVKSIQNTFNKATFVTYYRLEPSLLYRNIDQLTEMFLTRPEVQLKIINYETPADPILITSSSFTITGKAVAIVVDHPLGSVRMEGILLNEHSPDGAVLDLSLMEMSHYEQFQKYRKKYRTLEKLTQKIDFQIDHRVRIVAAGREFRFSLDNEQPSEHYFLPHTSSLTVYLEEIVSIGNEMLVEVIEEQTLNLSKVYESVSTFTYSLSFIHSFKLIFLLDVVKNTNLADKKMVSIRMLECSEPKCAVRIGTERNIHLAETSLQPVLEQYYDREYGYLSLNLKEVDNSTTIYDHLDKLTPSFPKYANLINQTLLNLQGANYLMFKLNEVTVKIPLVYIMDGFNVFHGTGGWVKFYIESSKQAKVEGTVQRDKRRLYHLSINEVWNLTCMLGRLSECNIEQLQLRVACESTIYSIPFRRGSKKGSVKEQKVLEDKNQLSIREGNSLTIITRHSQTMNLEMLTTTALHNYFLIQITSSATISFQVTANSKIYLEGELSKPDLCPNQPILHLLSSTDGLTKVMLEVLCVPLDQPNDSQNTFYHLRHLLSFPDQPLEECTYDVQIKRNEGKKRTLKSQLAVGSRLSQFSEGGFFVKGAEAELELTIRRMHFNQQTNYFDNELLLQKRILINPFQIMLQKDTIPIKILKECYQGIQLQFYDSVGRARVKYYLEIYAKKSPFFDYKDSSYIVKIPTFLWQVSDYPQDLQICTHMSRKDKNTSLKRIQHTQTQEVVLDHYNYNDGISIKTNLGIGYSKVMHVMKARCEVGLNIEWNNESEWYLGVISLGKGNVLLLMKRLFDPYEQKKENSKDSQRTVSQGRSDRSDLHKIDPFAKTVRNLDFVRLKQQKNQLVQEGRILVTRYVQRQQKILFLNRKISEIEEAMNLQGEKKQERKPKEGKKNRQAAQEARKFYDSICECGAKNPQFKGFCEECLGRLRKSYEAYFKQYKEKSYSYEIVMFDKYNQREKIQRLKEKVKSQKYSQVPSESTDNMGLLMRNLECSNIRNRIQMLHAELFDLREKRKSIVDTSNWQLENIEGKIRMEDEQIYQGSQELAGLRVKLLETRDSFKRMT